MRTPIRLAFALTAASTLALTIAGCSGAPSSSLLGAQPSMQQSLAQTAGYDQRGKKGRHGPPSEIINQFNSLPSTTQATNFEIVLRGNLVQAICGGSGSPCLGEPLYGPYNPFCPPSQGPSNPCYPTVTYNPTANTTTVTFSGPVLYDNVGIPNYYHFGLFATPSQTGWLGSVEATSYWSYPSAPNNGQPFVSINKKSNAAGVAGGASPLAVPQWEYAEVFVSVALKPGGPVVYGTWNDLGYVQVGTNQPHFTFQNFGSQPLYVVSSGIILDQAVPTDPECLKDPACPEDMKILSTLSFTGSPPPGEPNSSFIPLQFPPAKILKPTK